MPTFQFRELPLYALSHSVKYNKLGAVTSNGIGHHPRLGQRSKNREAGQSGPARAHFAGFFLKLIRFRVA